MYDDDPFGLSLRLLLRPYRAQLARSVRVASFPLCPACHEGFTSATGWKLGGSLRPCVACGLKTHHRAYLVNVPEES